MLAPGDVVGLNHTAGPSSIRSDWPVHIWRPLVDVVRVARILHEVLAFEYNDFEATSALRIPVALGNALNQAAGTGCIRAHVGDGPPGRSHIGIVAMVMD